MSRSLPAAFLLLGAITLAGCDDSRSNPTSPSKPAATRAVQPTQGVDLDTRILALADSIFPKGLSTAFDSRWADLRRQLATNSGETLPNGKKTPAADTSQMYINLVEWMRTQTRSLTPPAGETADHATIRLRTFSFIRYISG